MGRLKSFWERFRKEKSDPDSSKKRFSFRCREKIVGAMLIASFIAGGIALTVKKVRVFSSSKVIKTDASLI